MSHPLVRLWFAPFAYAALAFGHYAVAEAPVYTITTLPADIITPRSARLHGVLEANGTYASGVFEWGATPALGQQTTGSQTLVPHTEPANLSFYFSDSLTPNTTYYYRARLVDGGVILHGEILSFTTLPPSAPELVLKPPFLPATATSATLGAWLNTNGLDTTLMIFVDGLNHGSQLLPAATPSFPLVSMRVNGLERNAAHSAYAVATNAAGAATSNEVTFRTSANFSPYANADTFLIPYGEPAQLNVLANDSDIDGDTLTITQAGTDGAGQVTTDGTALVYTPAAGFSGSVLLYYVISDGFGGSATANVYVTVKRPTKPETVVLMQTGDAVPDVDSTSWLDFGMPALDEGGRIAMKGRIMGPTGVASAVAGRAPTEFGVVLKTGDFAPDETGALSSDQCVEVFDPVINQSGQTAFLASVVGPAVGSVPKEALFTNVRLGLQRLAEAGSLAPGAGGAVWDHFISISAQSNEIVVVARLSGPGVTDANDMGAWAWGVEGTWPWDPTAWRLLLREGDPIAAASGSKTVASFAMLGSVTGSSGQQRHHAFNAYTAQVRTTDGATGIAHGTKSAPFALAVQTDVAVNVHTAAKTISGARWKTIGVPAANWQYPSPDYVFCGKLKPGVAGVVAASAAGIFGRDNSVDGVRAYVRAGEVVHSRAGTSLGVKYAGFQNPVLSEDDAALVFTATVAGPGVTASNDTVLAYGDGTNIVALTREGNLAPGTTARFANFLSVAAMNRGSSNTATPLFTAQLSGDDVTLDNNKGLWACDQQLKPQLLLRKGASLRTANGLKRIRNFTVLAPADGSPGVTRSFNTGSVVSRVTFTDATQAIVLSVLP